MKTARLHAKNHVANSYILLTQQFVGLDNSDGGTGNVILICGEKPRMFCGFATDQCNSDRRTGLGNAAHDVGNSFWHNFSAGDVVGHEQTLCANHNNVVDNHANEILPDCVVLVDCLRNRNLGTDSIR